MATPSSSQVHASQGTATSSPAGHGSGTEDRGVVSISDDEETMARPGSKRKRTSAVWADFEEVCVDGVWKAKCVHCQKKLSATSRNGTTHLKTHLQTCIYNNKKPGQKIQSNLRFGNTEKGTVAVENYVFDQEVARRALYCMIILHEYPLSIVDHHGFRKFVSALQPLFKMGTRNTIRRDILSFYAGEKRKARIFLQRTNLEEEALPHDENDFFDVLGWWKLEGARYPTLRLIARDILAIPITTVASESAFSTSGRVLSEHRSRLTPKMLEALMCAQSWLRHTLEDGADAKFNSFWSCLEDIEEEMKEESCVTNADSD